MEKKFNSRAFFKGICVFTVAVQSIALSSCSSSEGLIQENYVGEGSHDTSLLYSVPEAIWRVDFQRSITGELDKELQLRLKENTDMFLEMVPAISIAIALAGEGIWVDHRGSSSTSTGIPVTDWDLFQIASISKTFTASIVMQLIEEEQILIDDPVSDWYPNIPDAHLMTIEHLLRHTSGLLSFDAIPELGLDYRTPDETIELASAQGLQFVPGTQWSYSNTGYAVLGRIIELIEGDPLHEVIDKRIVEPLALDHTVLRHLNDAVSIVDGHYGNVGVQVEDDYATAYAAGGLASTAEDVLKFWHAVMGGEVVSVDQVQSMYSMLAPMDDIGQMFYGMGVQFYHVDPGPGQMLGHTGGIAGFRSIVAYVPEDDLYIAVLFNDQDAPVEAGLWSLIQTIRKYRKQV